MMLSARADELPRLKICLHTAVVVPYQTAVSRMGTKWHGRRALTKPGLTIWCGGCIRRTDHEGARCVTCRPCGADRNAIGTESPFDWRREPLAMIEASRPTEQERAQI